MKHKLFGAIAAFAITVLPLSADAGPGLFSSTGSVSYSNGTRQLVSGFTPQDCAEALRNAINNPPPGETVVSTQDCVPNQIENPVRWRVDPFEIGCIYCGLLNRDNIFDIYPDFGDLVIDLFKDYGLNEYQLELAKLNARYDVKGFRQEMGKLERYINQKQK